MLKATWNGALIAGSADTVMVEGNHSFPLESVNRALRDGSSHHTTCPWQGVANYHDVVVDGQRNKNACWYHPTPGQATASLTGRVAFWKGVRVEA